jgi:hypothetical protein
MKYVHNNMQNTVCMYICTVYECMHLVRTHSMYINTTLYIHTVVHKSNYIYIYIFNFQSLFQCKELCALHALNNLFQCAGTFQQSQLDAICHELAPRAWVNPHKSLLGLGNYDVNVLSRALQELGYEAVWFDKRKYVHIFVIHNY